MDSEQLIRESFEAMNDRDMERAFSMFADDLVVNNFVPRPLGLVEFRALNLANIAAFPNWRFDLQDIQIEGDRITIVLQTGGTQTGPFNLPGMPVIPATGRSVSLPGKFTCQLGADYQIHRMDFDNPLGGGFEGLLAQLGIQVPGK